MPEIECQCDTAHLAHEQQQRSVCPNCGMVHEEGWFPTGEYIDGAEPPEPDDDGDGDDGQKLSVAWYDGDDLLTAKRSDWEGARSLTPGHRTYQVLYICALHQCENGPGFTTGEVFNAYSSYLPGRASVTASLARLRTFGVIGKTDPFRDNNIKNYVRPEGIEYLRRHGKPTDYPAPEDVNGVLD